MTTDDTTTVINLADRAEQQMRLDYLAEMQDFVASIEHPLLTDDVIEILNHYLAEADAKIDGLGCAATSLFFSNDHTNDNIFSVHFLSTYAFVILTDKGHSKTTDRLWSQSDIVDNQYMQLNIRRMDTAERKSRWGVEPISNDAAHEKLIEYFYQWDNQTNSNDPLIFAVLMIFHCLVDYNSKVLSLDYEPIDAKSESIMTLRIMHQDRHFELIYNYPKMNRLFQTFNKRFLEFQTLRNLNTVGLLNTF